MPMKKGNVMLQFPVKAEIAITWHNLVKLSGYTQGELFTCLIADLLNTARQKGVKTNAKEIKKANNKTTC